MFSGAFCAGLIEVVVGVGPSLRLMVRFSGAFCAGLIEVALILRSSFTNSRVFRRFLRRPH